MPLDQLANASAGVLLVAAIVVALRNRRHRSRADATLTAVVSALQEGLIVRDTDGEVLLANPAADELTGLQYRARSSYDEVTSVGYVREDGTRAVADELPSARARRTGVPVIGEVGRLDLPKVGTRWLRVTAVPVRAGDKAVGTATTLTDITAEREAVMRLRAAEYRFRVAFEEAPIGMVMIGANGRVSAVNSAFCCLIGRPERDLLRLVHSDLRHPDHIDPETDELDALVRGERDACTMETRYLRADGTEVWATVHVNAFRADDPADTVYLTQVVDLTAEQKLREQLAHAATHDPLTGLANRRLLEERLELVLAAGARRGHAVGLLFCDLDDFKAINDRFGHGVGDRVLAAVAERLTASARGDHTVARVGGDEFVVLSPTIAGPQEALGFEARVRREVERPLEVEGITVEPRVSVGVHIAAPGTSADAAMRAADVAMYRAKASRREDAHVAAAVQA